MRKKVLVGLVGGSVATLAALFLVPAAVSAAADGPSSQGAVAAPAAATRVGAPAARSAANDCLGFSATSPQTRVVTDDFARSSTATVFTTLPCGSTSVRVPRGRSAVVVAEVDAEVSCQGPATQWCLGRVLIGGVEAEPNAPEPDSFAWATARADLNQWESNAFTRTRRVSCARTAPKSGCVFTVVTQVRNHAAGMVMRIDDRTLHVQVNF